MAPSLLALFWHYLTGNLQGLQLKPGDRLDSDAERVLIVTRGTGQVVRDGPGGHDILLRIVRPYEVVADGEALMAETSLDLLEMPAGFNKRDRAAC
jgi:hypothetical protein